MTINYLILLLPLVCTGYEYDGITIKIELAPTEAGVTFEPSGEDIKIATDSDLAAFNLTKEKQFYGVRQFSGASATDIFTRSPTPWGDLYKKYRWREMRRQIKVKDIKLANITTEKKIVGERDYTNLYTDTEVELKGLIRRFSYDDFLTKHSWSGDDKISASVNYMLRRPYLPYPLEHETISTVGKTKSGTGIQVVGFSDVEAIFKLQPGQKAKMYLLATTVVTKFRVQYETVLSGNFVVNYEHKHDGHHFWAFRANLILAAANMSTTAVTNEFVEIRNIKDFEIKVVDATTGLDIQFTSEHKN